MRTPEQINTPWTYGLLAACVALPWLNPFASSPSTAVIPLLLSWMLAACAVLVVVDMPMVKKPWVRRDRLWLVFMGAWLIASLIWVPAVVDRALTAGLFASLTCVWLMWAVGRRAAVNERLLTWLTAAILLAALVSSVLGILQYLDLAKALSPWVNQPLKGDGFANLRQRNQFASLTGLGLVALFGWTLAHSKTKPLSAKAWSLILASLNLLSAGLACSVSRTGAIEWLVVSALVAWWLHRQSTQEGRSYLLALVVAAPLLVVVWSMVMPWLSLQLTGEWGASLILRVAGQAQDYGPCGGRRVLWGNVITLIAQQPWWGWGWGETDYAHFMTQYKDMRFCDMLDNAHNFPLHLALELGVPFAVVLLAAMAAWVWRRRPWQETQASRVMAWCWLLVLGVHSMLEYPLWYGPFQMALGLGVGLLWSLPQTSAVPKMHEELQMEAQTGTLLVAAILFMGCFYAAWDFNRVGQIYRPATARDAAYRDDPLHHAKQSWLFKNQADFAELTMQTVTADNAAALYPQALRLMHYSPEARVVQRAIDSGKLLGHDEQAQGLADRLDDVKRHTPR